MKYLIFVFMLMISNISAEEGVLLFYPSLKFAEMSGGYPARVESDITLIPDGNELTKMKCMIKFNENFHQLKFLNHASYCPCENGKYEIKKCPEIQLPTLESVALFFRGHLHEIKFYIDE